MGHDTAGHSKKDGGLRRIASQHQAGLGAEHGPRIKGCGRQPLLRQPLFRQPLLRQPSTAGRDGSVHEFLAGSGRVNQYS